jgi:uncharacterized protein (DUF1778 family)
MSDAVKNRRLEFRTTEATRSLVEHALETANLSLSEFAEQCLRREAQRLLADQVTFTLSSEAQAAWDALNERAARDLPGLAHLMKRRSPFSE